MTKEVLRNVNSKKDSEDIDLKEEYQEILSLPEEMLLELETIAADEDSPESVRKRARKEADKMRARIGKLNTRQISRQNKVGARKKAKRARKARKANRSKK